MEGDGGWKVSASIYLAMKDAEIWLSIGLIIVLLVSEAIKGIKKWWAQRKGKQ